MRSGATGIAYETVTDARGSLPLLTPMSEVAGRMSVQVGAHAWRRSRRPRRPARRRAGRGAGQGGDPGRRRRRHQCGRVAVGLGAAVTIIDRSLQRLRELDRVRARETLSSTVDDHRGAYARADLVIGAVLVAGAAAPRLVRARWSRRMRPGSVLVDIAIDQGGCFETSRPTTHADPTYVEEGVMHYCVTNMPGAVRRTATSP